MAIRLPVISKSVGVDVIDGHGNFSIDADPFFVIPAGWAISGGVASFSNPTAASISKGGILITGMLYSVSYTVNAITGAGVRVNLGANVGITRTTPGTFSETIVSQAGSMALQGLAGATATIDNFAIREYYNEITPIGTPGMLYGYTLIGGTSQSSITFRDGSAGTILWKDSLAGQTAIGDKSKKITLFDPIVFSNNIYVELSGTGAYCNVSYAAL